MNDLIKERFEYFQIKAQLIIISKIDDSKLGVYVWKCLGGHIYSWETKIAVLKCFGESMGKSWQKGRPNG